MRQSLVFFVRGVTAEERQQLERGLRSAEAFHVRRCQMVLASESGAGVPRIAHQGGCREQPVRNVVPAFNLQGERGSRAAPGGGAPESADLRSPVQSVDLRVSRP
jgi:hypothetical protein